MGANELGKITRRYRALCELVPLTPIATKSDYNKAVTHLNRLLDAGGASETHPLAGLVDALGEMIHSYEKRQAPMAEAKPGEVLRYLMQEHGIKQIDLSEIASQGTISEILSGRREISKAVAKKMAARFQVSAAVFL